MCCSNAFCDGDADVENFEAKNQPKLADQPTINNNRVIQRNDDGVNAYTNIHQANASLTTLNRGETQMHSAFGGGAGHSAYNNMYEEPQVEVLANSRRDQLTDALTQSARKNNDGSAQQFAG